MLIMKDIPVLILGSTGLLGTDLSRVFQAKTLFTECPKRDVVDVTEMKKLLDYIQAHPSKIVINAVGYTKVDQSEIETKSAFLLNAEVVSVLAKACEISGKILVHFSTDYIFDGEKEGPYLETDSPNPIGVYGKSKLEGEYKVLSQMKQYYIFRIQWIYGHNGPNFVNTMLRLANEKPKIAVVSDQWGSPTWAKEIANKVYEILNCQAPFGVYHLAATGYTHWADYATFLFKEKGLSCEVEFILTKHYKTLCQRPLNSRLSVEKYQKLGLTPFLTWQESLRLFLKENQ